MHDLEETLNIKMEEPTTTKEIFNKTKNVPSFLDWLFRSSLKLS
jgi:hypothetical protein